MFVLLSTTASAFEDNFNDGDASDWTYTGSWTVSTTAPAHDSYYLAHNAASTATATHTISGVPNYWELWFYMGTGGVPQFYFDYNGVTGNYLSCSAGTLSGTGFTYNPVAGFAYSTWYKIVISRSGGNYNISIYNADGSLKDNQISPITTTVSNPDRIMLRHSVASGNVRFDNVIASMSNPVGAGSTSISFNAVNYSVNEVATVTFGISNPDFVNHQYVAVIYDPEGFWAGQKDIISGSSNPDYLYITLNKAGTWEADLMECDSLGNNCTTYLDTDTANVQGGSSIYFTSDSAGLIPIGSAQLGSTIYMHTLLDNPDFTNNEYGVDIIKPDGTIQQMIQLSSANQNHTWYTSVNPTIMPAGVWTAKLQRFPKTGAGSYQLLKTTTISLYSITNGVYFDKENYGLNDLIRINYQTNYPVNLYLYDSQGYPLLLEFVNGTGYKTFQLTQNSSTGIYTAVGVDSNHLNSNLVDTAIVGFNNTFYPIGTITTSKSTYNTSEVMTVNYTSNFIGYVQIKDYKKAVSPSGGSFNITIPAYWIPTTYTLGLYTDAGVFIAYKQITIRWSTMDIVFLESSYNSGDTMKAMYQSINASTITLMDASNNTVYSESVSANTNGYFYYVVPSSKSLDYGTWTIKIVDDVTAAEASDTTYVTDTGVITTPLPTPGSVTTNLNCNPEDSSLLGVTGYASCVTLGKLDVSGDGEIQDSEIVRMGNRSMSSLIFFVFVILIAGAYNMMRRPKRRR